MRDPSLHVVYAHPYPTQSTTTMPLLEVFRQRDDVTIHALYDLYPDGNIDIATEQAAILAAPDMVWLTPLYWYSVPGLMKLWFDQVLSRGWAYGEGGTALHGRRCLWVTSTGGNEFDYSGQGVHARPFADFVAPVEQTARFCGMEWQVPFVVHGALQLDAAQREAAAQELAARIEKLIASGEQR